MQSTPSEKPQGASTTDRRGFVRYARSLGSLWQLLGLTPSDLTGGEVLDLSAGGVGLLLDRALSIGKSLFVRLPTASRGWVSYLVRVRRCEPTEEGRFVVGCQFLKPLSAEELQSHLE